MNKKNDYSFNSNQKCIKIRVMLPNI